MVRKKKKVWFSDWNRDTVAVKQSDKSCKFHLMWIGIVGQRSGECDNNLPWILRSWIFILFERRSFKILPNSSSLLWVKFQVLSSMRGPRCICLGSILINQVRVFGATAAAKVLDLHDLRQHSFVEIIFQCRNSEIALEYIIILILFSYSGNNS